MPRDDGKKYGAGGQLIQEIMEPQEPVKKPSVKRGFKKSSRKKTNCLPWWQGVKRTA